MGVPFLLGQLRIESPKPVHFILDSLQVLGNSWQWDSDSKRQRDGGDIRVGWHYKERKWEQLTSTRFERLTWKKCFRLILIFCLYVKRQGDREGSFLLLQSKARSQKINVVCQLSGRYSTTVVAGSWRKELEKDMKLRSAVVGHRYLNYAKSSFPRPAHSDYFL